MIITDFGGSQEVSAAPAVPRTYYKSGDGVTNGHWQRSAETPGPANWRAESAIWRHRSFRQRPRHLAG